MDTAVYNNLKNLDIRCILFDLDNTLIETRKADSAACAKIADVLINKYKVNLETATSICSNFLTSFRKCPENTLMGLDTWRTLLWSNALGQEFQHHAEKIYEQWLVQRYTHLAPSNKVMNLLKNLRKKYQIGLITNGTSSAQWEKIDKLNIKNLFDTILVSGDLYYEKPDKRIFWRACEELNVHPKHCLMVGDKLETDILGGLEAKLGATIWLPLQTSGSNKTTSDPVPDYVIDDVMDLHWLINDDKRNNRFYPEEDCCSNGSDGR